MRVQSWLRIAQTVILLALVPYIIARRAFSAWNRWAYGVAPCGRTLTPSCLCPAHGLWCVAFLSLNRKDTST